MSLPAIPILPPAAVALDSDLQADFEFVIAVVIAFSLLTLAILLARAIRRRSSSRRRGGGTGRGGRQLLPTLPPAAGTHRLGP